MLPRHPQPPAGRFLVYVDSILEPRPPALERALHERLRRWRLDRRPRVVHVDAVQRPDLVERFKIASLPAVLVLEDGIVRGRFERPERAEADEIATALASPPRT